MAAPILQIVIEGARKEWLETDKAAITNEWWESLLGYVPDNPDAIDDVTLLCLTVLWLQESLKVAESKAVNRSAVNGTPGPPTVINGIMSR